MDKITLNDGGKEIKKISVLSLFRDCSQYLDNYFNAVSGMEAMYNIEFEYFFLENDSKDDTRKKLKQFSKSHKCKLLLLQLEKDYSEDDLSVNLERIHALSTLRNKLKNTFAPFDSDYMLFIDSGIYFRPEILKDMFSHDIVKNNIAMMVPYTAQIYTKDMIMNRKEFEHVKSAISENSTAELVNLEHAYDTYSSIDKDGIFFYPFCAFDKCVLCRPNRHHFEYKLAPSDESIIEVRSTFNGFAIVDTPIFNNKMVLWDTICLNLIKATALCEHVLFCDRIKTISGKKIVVLQNIKNVYRTN